MKKLLIGLVLASVLSVCAFAVSPAVNVLTGTKDALNFENAANDYFYNSNTSTASYFTFGVQNDATGGGRGKVYSVVADMEKIIPASTNLLIVLLVYSEVVSSLRSRVPSRSKIISFFIHKNLKKITYL